MTCLGEYRLHYTLCMRVCRNPCPRFSPSALVFVRVVVIFVCFSSSYYYYYFVSLQISAFPLIGLASPPLYRFCVHDPSWDVSPHPK